MTIKWIKEEDQKPPFDTPVLIWNDCDECRNNVPHAHTLVAAPWNNPNSFQKGTYVKRITLNDPYYHKYPVHMQQDHWCPSKPSHWAYVDSPFITVEL